MEALFAEISDQLPEFAGLTVAGGQVVIHLTDANAQRRAEQVVRERLADREPALNLDKFIHAPASFAFQQLYVWKTKLAPIALRGGASGIGIRVTSNNIVIDSPDSVIATHLAQAAASAGVPKDAIWIQLGVGEQHVGTLSDMFTPAVPGGAGIWWITDAGNAQSCTGSVNAMYGPYEMLLIASHCSRVQGNFDNTPIYQGGWTSSHKIGIEVTDPAFTPCYVTEFCRWSDAALMSWAHAAGGRYGQFGAIATTTQRGVAGQTEWSGTINNRNIVSVWDMQPFEGEVIDRIGGSTGWLYGTVYQSCVEVPVPGMTGHNLQCQTRVLGGGAAGGDSGGPAFSLLPGDDAMYAGVVWGAFRSGREVVGFTFSAFTNVQQDIGSLIVY